MAKLVQLGPFQNMKTVHWKQKESSSASSESSSEAFGCGLIMQVGRFHTGGGTFWQVQASASRAINCGTFGGTTNPDQWDALPYTKLANNIGAFDQIVTGDFGFAGNSGTRGAVFNFEKMILALGSLPKSIKVTLSVNVFGFLSNVSQWHFGLDTFEIAHDGADPTFTNTLDMDNASAKVGSDIMGAAPWKTSTSRALDRGRIYVPHTSAKGIFINGSVSAFVNTRTGKISAFAEDP